MKKLVMADFDAETKTLTLFDPLEGVKTSTELTIELAEKPARASVREWHELVGSLKGDAGDELAARVEEMFPTRK